MDINSHVAIENGVELEENIAEGVVIKTLKVMRDRRGNRILSKYKSNKWAENSKAPKVKKLNPEKATMSAAAREFASCCVTEGRVATVVEHITRDGNTEISMKRTSDFLRAFVGDVMKEYEDVYDKLKEEGSSAVGVYNKVVSSQAVVLWKKYVEEVQQ